MPGLPFVISGTTSNIAGNIVGSVRIVFVVGDSSETVFSDVSGTYVFDAANVGYVDGGTVEYSAFDEFNNEFVSGEFAGSGGTKTLNLSLDSRGKESFVLPPANRTVQVHTVGGEPVSGENPFPVQTSKIPTNDGSLTLSYDGSDNLVTVVKELGGVSYTRSLTYDGSNNLTGVGRWVVS